MEQGLSLLIVEDVAAEAELAVHRLKRAGLNCTWTRVETEAAFREALHELQPDLIISDFSLPGYSGSAALELTRREAPDIPFIFVSGTIGEERAIEALKSGAVDYVLKSNLERLAPAVRRALKDVAAREAQRAAELRIERLTRVLQMLSSINAGVVRIRDRTHLFEETCRVAHDVGKYAAAFVVLIDPATRTAAPVAWSGVNAELRDQVTFRVDGSPSDVVDDETATGRALRTGMEVVVCNDPARAGGCLKCVGELFAKGVDCLVSIPLLVDETPIGAFTVGALGSCPVDEDELRMLREVAANLSFALQYLHREESVRFLSYFDPLTGLAKRALFCERVARLLARHAGENAEVLVVAFDIERLGVINDSFGRHVGDQVVQFVADSVKGQFEGTDLAHLDGGNFAIVILGRDSYESSVRLLHERLASALSRPLVVPGHEIRVSVKAGLARFPENGTDCESLLQNAEAALHRARKSGERFLRHRREINAEVAERLALEHRLRAALDAGQFEVRYQPQLSISDGTIVGAEALLRWRDPGQPGLAPPAVFLSVLESTGLIVDVGEWVLHRAARDLARWQQLGFESMRIAVNVSPVQLRDPQFAERFCKAAGWKMGDRKALDIEITEGALLDDSSSVTQTLQALRATGAQISIDDFGTGYSSLSRLSKLPLDTLKIDRSFTSALVGDEISQAVVSTIVALARAFKLSTVAEGVETPQQFEILRTLGCEQSQGYLHGRPVTAEQFEDMLVAERNGSVLPSWGDLPE